MDLTRLEISIHKAPGGWSYDLSLFSGLSLEKLLLLNRRFVTFARVVIATTGSRSERPKHSLSEEDLLLRLVPFVALQMPDEAVLSIDAQPLQIIRKMVKTMQRYGRFGELLLRRRFSGDLPVNVARRKHLKTLILELPGDLRRYEELTLAILKSEALISLQTSAKAEVSFEMFQILFDRWKRQESRDFFINGRFRMTRETLQVYATKAGYGSGYKSWLFEAPYIEWTRPNQSKFVCWMTANDFVHNSGDYISFE